VNDADRLIAAVHELSKVILDSKNPLAKPHRKYNAFVLASARQTDNLRPRETRFDTLYGEAFG
jgi:hypothetical protein